MAIYSSGSVFAQKLLMGHVRVGGGDGDGETETKTKTEDLQGLVSGGWFDTVNAGLKGERESYERISGEMEVRFLGVSCFLFGKVGLC